MSRFVGKSPNHNGQTEEIVYKGNSDVELGSVATQSGAKSNGGSGSWIATTQQPLPFLLAFTDLYYSVKMPKKSTFLHSLSSRNRPAPDMTNSTGGSSQTKVLLNNISGEARGGEIFAVLGASGSGNINLFIFVKIFL